VILARRRSEDRPSRIILILLPVILLLSTFVFIALGVLVIQLIRFSFIENPNLPLENRFAIVQQKVQTGATAIVYYLTNSGGVMFLIADAVVIWRTWAIWHGRRTYMAIPILFLVAALVLSIISSTAVMVNASTVVISNDVWYAKTNLTAMACSLLANAASTSLVGVQSFRYYRARKHSGGIFAPRAIILLFNLAEAGLVYFVMQFVALILAINDNEPQSAIDYATQTWQLFVLYTSVTYPAVIVLLVAYNRSIANGTISNHDDLLATNGMVRRHCTAASHPTRLRWGLRQA